MAGAMIPLQISPPGLVLNCLAGSVWGISEEGRGRQAGLPLGVLNLLTALNYKLISALLEPYSSEQDMVTGERVLPQRSTCSGSQASQSLTVGLGMS